MLFRSTRQLCDAHGAAGVFCLRDEDPPARRHPPLAQRRPVVPLAFVRCHTGLDIVIDRADDVALGAMLLQLIHQLPDQHLRRGLLLVARALQFGFVRLGGAFLGETDDKGRMPSYGKVAIVVVVGNEDGAHHCAAELIQALTEVGFTCPPGSVTYWVGEAQGDKVYKDLNTTPKAVAETTAMLASNAAHLARLLKSNAYPGMD